MWIQLTCKLGWEVCKLFVWITQAKGKLFLGFWWFLQFLHCINRLLFFLMEIKCVPYKIAATFSNIINTYLRLKNAKMLFSIDDSLQKVLIHAYFIFGDQLDWEVVAKLFFEATHTPPSVFRSVPKKRKWYACHLFSSIPGRMKLQWVALTWLWIRQDLCATERLGAILKEGNVVCRALFDRMPGLNRSIDLKTCEG